MLLCHDSDTQGVSDGGAGQVEQLGQPINPSNGQQAAARSVQLLRSQPAAHHKPTCSTSSLRHLQVGVVAIRLMLLTHALHKAVAQRGLEVVL